MKTLTSITILGAAVLAFSCFHFNRDQKDITVPIGVKKAFLNWMKEHKVMYLSPKEFNYRLNTFAKTHERITEVNSKKLSYTFGHNQFSHLTKEEFIAKYTGLKVPENYQRNLITLEPTLNDDSSVDWREKGAVNPVKNQQQCGSCWAFSATASVEGAWKIAGNQLEDLSEQQLVDCSTAQGNHGCNGGWMDYAFSYLIANGQERTSDYPYKAVDQSCKYSASKSVAKVRSFSDVGKNDCQTLLKFAAKGPTSVAIAADSIQSYKNGVYSNASCGTSLDHGVTLVGYGHDDKLNKDFYIVRNSWGSGWGEQGYIRMDRGVQTSTGICGICMAASIANI